MTGSSCGESGGVVEKHDSISILCIWLRDALKTVERSRCRFLFDEVEMSIIRDQK